MLSLKVKKAQSHLEIQCEANSIRTYLIRRNKHVEMSPHTKQRLMVSNPIKSAIDFVTTVYMLFEFDQGTTYSYLCPIVHAN